MVTIYVVDSKFIEHLITRNATGKERVERTMRRYHLIVSKFS